MKRVFDNPICKFVSVYADRSAFSAKLFSISTPLLIKEGMRVTQLLFCCPKFRCKSHRKSSNLLTVEEYGSFVKLIYKKLYCKRSNGQTLAELEIKWLTEWVNQMPYNFELRKSAFLKALCSRAMKETPIQYLLKRQRFNNVLIDCKKPVFIPRPETEIWVNELIQRCMRCSSPIRILDLCTGTGCIGLSFAKAKSDWSVWCVDIDRRASILTKKNMRLNNITNVQVLCGDLFEAFSSSKDKNPNAQSRAPKAKFHQFFDIIVSNPPYISTEEYSRLPNSVKYFETSLSLVGNKRSKCNTDCSTDGNINCIEYYKEIIKKAPYFLKKRSTNDFPSLALEIGSNVSQILSLFDGGYSTIRVHKDFAGQDRLITAHIM